MSKTATNTIRLHRVLRAAPDKIYRAFLDADAMAKWLPPNGFTGKVHHLDAKVGGTYKMSFTNFTTGRSHAFGGKYLYLVGTPLALGSYWGLVPLAAMMPFLIWRLVDEERFLSGNLPGYAAYQRQVPHRLVPYVW